MARILWMSHAPLSPTGYGNQTGLIVPRLIAAQHAVAVFGFYGCEGVPLNFNGIHVYPKLGDVFGQDIVGAHAGHFNADMVLTFMDTWATRPEQYGGRPWVAWTPVDHDPLPPVVADKLKHCARPIAMSRFGLQQLVQAGFTDALYVPCAVDTEAYAPLHAHRVAAQHAAREALEWPRDRFIVGMVAKNIGCSPSRKSFPECLLAFAEFKRTHAPDALLYLHTNADIPDAWSPVNISELVRAIGLRPHVDVEVVSQYEYLTSTIPIPIMRAIYNGMDVLLNPARGEGFGLPILEAQACGTPVITGGWTSMPEITFAGWTIAKADAEPEWNTQNSWWFKPRVSAIVEALRQAYQQRGNAALSAAAREGAMEYEIGHVVDRYWLPALAETVSQLPARTGAQAAAA